MFEAPFRDLVREHIRSVWALELLLRLRSEPERLWRRKELVAALRASDLVVSRNLASLERSGLVISEDDHARFAPASPILQAFVDQLAEAHQQRPVALIALIGSQDRLQSLADAFRIKKEDP